MDSTTGKLLVPKHNAFNKVGHALHWKNSVFRKFTFDERIKRIARLLDFTSPKVVQSMYIFKQPKLTVNHENSVNDHVDSTFLDINPQGSLLGIWIALDNATVENGCLHFISRSHMDTSFFDASKSYHFVRTQKEIANNDKPLLEFTCQKPNYEGTFVPVEVQRGSIVLIDGHVIHKSEMNTSQFARHAYTFHIVESAGAKWSDRNWLQETDSYKFPSLFCN